MALNPRHAIVVALLAVLPVALFAVSRSEAVVGIALVNVLLIFGSLYVAFSPAEGNGHGSAV